MGTPIGRIVDPKMLFGREREIARIWELLLQANSNVRIEAPRRVGKSSVLKRLEYEAPGKGFVPVPFSLADCQSEDQFVRRLLDASWDHDGQMPWLNALLRSPVGRVLTGIRAGDYQFKPDEPNSWYDLSTAAQTMIKESVAPKLFLVDELPLFIAELLRVEPEGSRARRFLGWMKTLRENTRMRWVFAGSISMDAVAKQAKLSGALADMVVENKFGPFDRATARQFLVREAEFWKFTLTDVELDAMLHLTADYHIPYYLVLLFHEVKTARSEGVPFSEVALLSRPSHFNHWDERMNFVFGADLRDQAYAILGRAAQEPAAGLGRDAAFQLAGGPEHGKRVLDVLVHDGYLQRSTDGARYSFRCELVRRYWASNIA
ncbi:MAG: ATP-binding protein [Bryobacterales bacterium]|nr:ATP-binding protein [Bryobacterales bacterium]